MSGEKFDLGQLSSFTGSENAYRHSLVKSVVFTDAVKYLADGAGAYWLIDKIATLQIMTAIRREEFQVWKLDVSNGKGLLTCDDGNDNIVHAERITLTDFPEPGVKLYFEHGTIMLPSER